MLLITVNFQGFLVHSGPSLGVFLTCENIRVVTQDLFRMSVFFADPAQPDLAPALGVRHLAWLWTANLYWPLQLAAQRVVVQIFMPLAARLQLHPQSRGCLCTRAPSVVG